MSKRRLKEDPRDYDPWATAADKKILAEREKIFCQCKHNQNEHVFGECAHVDRDRGPCQCKNFKAADPEGA